MKRKITRNIMATLLATVMTFTCSTAYADSNDDTTVAISDQTELTDIGGYACYKRNGNYWTMIDGEECLVIDVQSAIQIDDEVITNAQSSSSDYPPNWKNNSLLSISSDISYNTKINLSGGDYYSPIFALSPSTTDYAGLEITTDHVVKHTYDLVFYYQILGATFWTAETVSISFDLFNRTHMIVIPHGDEQT